MPIFLSYVLLLVCALVLAGIGVIISLLGEKACLSKQCVGQAKFIDRGMNRDLNPCDDFYSFVCDNFQQFGSSIIDDIELKQLYRMVDYLAVPSDWEEDGRVEHIAKSLYQNCINDTQLETEGLRPLQRIVSKLGGIPFIDPLWDYEKKAEFNVVDNELKHFFNGLNSIFVYNRIIRKKINPSLNPKNETEDERKSKMYHSFSIPPHLYNAVAPHPENYLKYCIEFNKLFSASLATNKTITEKEKIEIREAANFKIKFLKLINKTRSCSDQPLKFIDLPYKRYFGKLDPESQSANMLQQYIARKAEPGSISTSNHALVTPNFDKYIEELDKLVKELPDRVLANYMGVESLIQMTPFLPPEYREVYDNYLKPEKEFRNRVLKDRDLHCGKLVKDAMTTALTSQYLKDNPKPPEGIAVLNSMIFELTMEVKSILKKVKWPSKRDRLKMLRLANKIKIVSPLPQDVLEKLQDKNVFELFYMIMCTTEDSTLESYLNVKVVRMLRNAQILNAKSETGKSFPFTVFHEDYDVFDPYIYFQEDSNSIVVPMAYLFYPSLDYLWPKYLSFGGLAVWIARLMIKTVGYDNVLHPETEVDEDGKTTPEEWWDKETIFRYESKMKCALKEYNQYLKPFRVKCKDANCLDETLYDAAAVQAAYFAYKEHTRMRFFVEPRIPYLTGYTVDQIFFIKFASSFCQYEGEGKRYKKDSDSLRVSSNFTVLYSLRNFPVFREVFECGKDAKMTKEKPCDIWAPAVTDE